MCVFFFSYAGGLFFRLPGVCVVSYAGEFLFFRMQMCFCVSYTGELFVRLHVGFCFRMEVFFAFVCMCSFFSYAGGVVFRPQVGFFFSYACVCVYYTGVLFSSVG